MKPKTAIEKGKRFENYVAKEIEAEGLGMARREIGSGSGKRKGDIFSSLPFLLECKNQKHLNWWQSITQAQKQAQEGNWDRNKWCLIVRDPRKPEFQECYAMIDLWEFLKLLKKNSEPRIKEPDKDLKWRLENLKQQCQQVIKKL